MSGADKPHLTIPAYDLAMHEFMTLVMDGMIGVDPMLGQIRVRVTGHAGPTRNVPGPQPVDHPLTTFQEIITIHADVIRETDVESFVAALVELAAKYEEAMGTTLVRTLTDVTEAVGNVVDAQGLPLSWDHLLDALEMTEFTFDEDGRLHVKQFLMNAETDKQLRAIEMTPEQRQRHEELIRTKKEQWDAQKRTRRLPRRDQGTGV